MKRLLLLTAVLLAACSSGATGPQGIDPTVQVSNLSSMDTLFFTWRDGQGITGADTVPPGAGRCEKFLAQADSAYFEAHTRNVNGFGATYTQPWFDPSTRPGWTMQITENSNHTGGPSILVRDVSPTEPC